MKQVDFNLNRKKRILLTFILSRIVYLCIIYASGSSITDIRTLWDNEHYVAIAQEGYIWEWQTAFFPVIPLLIRLIGQNGVVILNQLAVLASMFLMDEWNEKEDFFIIDFFAMLPIGFFSIMLYTEALLFFFTLLAFYLFVKRRFGYGLGIVIGIGVAIKSIGAMLFFAIFIGMCYLWYRKQISIREIMKTYIPATIISCMYPVYLQIMFGNWKLFMDCQYEYWARMKTNPLEELWIQFQVIFYNGTDMYAIYRVNEIVTLIVVAFMIYGAYCCIIACRNMTCNRVNAMVMLLYLFFSLVAINASIRIPFDSAPTTSFYRYYYSLFPVYLFTVFMKERVKDVIFIGSFCISLLSAVLFSVNYFFY